MPKMLLDLEVTRVDLVEEGANSEAFIKIFKQKGGGNMTIEEVIKSLDEKSAQVVKDALTAAKAAAAVEESQKLEAAEKQLEAAEEELKKAREATALLEAEIEKSKKADEGAEEDILKGVSPEVKELIEKSRLQAKAAEDSVKKMLAVETEREALAKAKAVEHIGVPEGELVELFKGLNIDEALSAKVYEVLKTADTVIKESAVFKEAGSSGEATAGDADAAWAKIESKATEIAKARGISKENAVTAVLNEHPEMYKQYVAAQ